MPLLRPTRQLTQVVTTVTPLDLRLLLGPIGRRSLLLRPLTNDALQALRIKLGTLTTCSRQSTPAPSLATPHLRKICSTCLTVHLWSAVYMTSPLTTGLQQIGTLQFLQIQSLTCILTLPGLASRWTTLGDGTKPPVALLV